MRCRCGNNDVEYLITINHVDMYFCDVCQDEFHYTDDSITPETRLRDLYGE
jgi:hypothetical protein